jgi:hypothetical protein
LTSTLCTSQNIIWYYPPDGEPTGITPESLVEDQTEIQLRGGKIVLTTHSEIGICICVPGARMVLMTDIVDHFHVLPDGVSVGTFKFNNSYMQGSGRMILFPGTSLMNVEFASLRIGSGVDAYFNFNAQPQPQPHSKSQPQPRSQSQPQPRSVQLDKKYRGVHLLKLKRNGHGFIRPPGRPPSMYPFWCSSQGDYFGYFYANGDPYFHSKEAEVDESTRGSTQ